MRRISYEHLVEAARDLFLETNAHLRPDILAALQDAASQEQGYSQTYLQLLLQNAQIAQEQQLPLSRDPGLLAWFVEIGGDVVIEGGLLHHALQEGVREALKASPALPIFLDDPLDPTSLLSSSLPSSLHLGFYEGEEIRIACMRIPHTAEMSTTIRVLPPAAKASDILEAVTEAVAERGALACPPLVVGVGLGGSLDTIAHLAQTALLRPIGKPHQSLEYVRLEQDLLFAINQLRLGPGALGGKITALAVHLRLAPSHRSAVPIAIYLQNYALRSAEITL